MSAADLKDPAIMRKLGFSAEDIALMLSQSDDDDDDDEDEEVVRLPHGLKRYLSSSLSDKEAREIYQRDQLLWLSLDTPKDKETCQNFGMESLKRLHTLFPTALSRYFSIENAGSHNRADINPDALYGNDGKQLLSKKISPFYASSILQRDEEAAQAFFSTVPFSTPPHLGAGAAEHDDGTWLFFGHNPPPAGNAADADGIDAVSKGKGSASKRRKLIGGAKPGKAATLSGRAEHTDKVSHDGTWHVQLAGTKTWLIRPDAASLEWKGCPPELKKETPGVVQRGAGGLRLQVDVAEGDFLCINTRIWYHRTDIQVQTQSKDALSISYARDFYLCSSGEKDGNNGGDDDDDDAGIDVEQGSELKRNDADSLDPRLFAKSNIACGDVALFEEQLPDELSIPRSLHPSCELVEAEVDGVVRNRVFFFWVNSKTHGWGADEVPHQCPLESRSTVKCMLTCAILMTRNDEGANSACRRTRHTHGIAVLNCSASRRKR